MTHITIKIESNDNLSVDLNGKPIDIAEMIIWAMQENDVISRILQASVEGFRATSDNE